MQLLRTVCFVVIFFGFTGQIAAQVEYRQKVCDTVRLNKKHLKSYFSDYTKILISPLHWNNREWGSFALATGTTVFLFSQDNVIRDFFQRNRSTATHSLSDNFFEPVGSGLYSLPLLSGMYIYGAIKHDNRAVRTGLNGIKAFIFSGTLNYIPKLVFQRHRPDASSTSDPFQWDGPFAGFANRSFPSGHTVTAFAVATMIASEYKQNVWVPVLAYTIASGAGLSRIHDDRHWASDVFFAAVLGYACGKFVYHTSCKNPSQLSTASKKPKGFTVVINFSGI